MTQTAFQKLRANKDKSLEALTKKLEATSQNYTDDRYWKLTKDAAGNGSATIRFLPPPNEEGVPFVKIWEHSFKNPANGRYYIEKSLTTIGQQDPIGILNSKLWAAGDQDTAKLQKRKLSYVSNILVIKDSANPENEGKVFLYKYGQKIFDKIKECFTKIDEDDDSVKFDPFNLWTGANFRLRVKNTKVKLGNNMVDMPNYDSSKFDSQSEIFDDEDEIEALYAKTYSLQELLDPSNFKTVEELQKRLDFVLDNKSNIEENIKPRTKSEPEEKSSKNPKTVIFENDSDDELAELQNLFNSIDDE